MVRHRTVVRVVILADLGDGMVGSAASFVNPRERRCTMEDSGETGRLTAVDDVTRQRTARRLMMARLRVQIARLEAQEASGVQIAQARRELRALTGGACDDTD